MREFASRPTVEPIVRRGLLDFLCSSYFPALYQNNQMCDLAFFIFDEAKCLAAISPFGEEVSFSLRQPFPFFTARILLRHQLVAFARDRQDAGC